MVQLLRDGKGKTEDFYFTVKIPANTNAKITLPVDSVEKARENGMPLSDNKALKNIRVTDRNLVIEAGSGEYRFEIIE